ncbi:retrovirus-related pol polyprotein from transposon TNT 1-94 [Tanacetum coccineum]|uniref:Retrovirus-related pol polyprotein from transposon TNT 1-94 n=1 Tax=Tanacetum coccineum TaxID=301880 RepID=A0ABQ4WU24_9ASTR
MLSTKPNLFYDPNMKTGFGYQNPKRLKKAIKAHPKMYNGKYLKYDQLNINLLDYEKTLKDTEKSRLKMKDKMNQLDYAKLNKLYESFVPQKEIFADQTYLSPPSTSAVTPESSPQKSSIPPKKMPKESVSSVRRPSSSCSSGKNSVLLNTRILPKTVGVHDRNNKNTNVTYQINVVKNKNLVENVNAVNALKVPVDVLCVSCDKNVLIPCHDKCFAKYKLFVNANVGRALFTTPRTVKYMSVDTTPVVAKTRFAVFTPFTAKEKDSNASQSTLLFESASTLSNYMRTKVHISMKWQKWFKRQPNFSWPPKRVTAKTTSSVTKSRDNVVSHSKTPVTVKKWVAESSTLPFVSSICVAEKFMGTICFRNDQFVAITGYGYYDQGNLTICHGEDLLTGSHDSNLYTISIFDMATSSLVCLMSKATSTKSWLWHRRLSYLNFGTINHLTKQDLVDGLLKFKYDKDHLCPAYKQRKSKKATLKSKLVLSTHSKLEMTHMDLCGLMRIENINGKRYILIIVDDYSHYTWVYFLCIKNEAPEMIIKFITQIQRNITPQENGVVERRNQTLVEAAHTMLIFSKAPKFLWAEAISTACFTQNHSLVHTHYNKTPYELIKNRIPNRFSNRQLQNEKIMEIIHVKFDELKAMASECNSLGPGQNCSNFQDSSEDSNETPSKEDLDNLFGPLYEEYYETRSFKVSTNSAATTLNNENTSSLSSSIVEENEAPQIVSSSEEPIANEPTTLVSDDIVDESIQENTLELDGNTFINPLCSNVLEEAEPSSTN